MSWITFALVLAAFFLTHSIPVRPQVKGQLQAVLGQRGFTISYSILSVFMLGLLVFATRNAPYVALWPQAPWQKYLVLAGMFTACLIAAFAIARPNPFSFGGARNEAFQAHRPGIVRVTRHPLLVVLGLWAGLHLLPNGDLAHAIMFGAFLASTMLGAWTIDRRKQGQMGLDAWHALRRDTANAPMIQRPENWAAVMRRLLLGAAAFLVLILLHGPVIGISALPS